MLFVKKINESGALKFWRKCAETAHRLISEMQVGSFVTVPCRFSVSSRLHPSVLHISFLVTCSAFEISCLNFSENPPFLVTCSAFEFQRTPVLPVSALLCSFLPISVHLCSSLFILVHPCSSLFISGYMRPLRLTFMSVPVCFRP